MIILGYITLFAIIAVGQAFTIACLWFWFAVPLGLPPLGLAHSMGASMLVYILAGTQNAESSGDGDSNLTGRLLSRILTLAITLLVGWGLSFWV